EKRVKSQWVRIRATAEGPVVIAARDLAYGEKLSSSDVDVTERELTDLEGFVFDAEAVIGMSARRSLRAGELITTDDVKRPTMVKRGEVVRVIARGKRFAVATLAKARAAGQQGDFILLENLDSKEVVRGRVIDQNLVQIDVLEVMQ
ncbi:MAG TPA: flagellar basal body P-ring formation chaperone FlgA, partial [Acidobacteriota bacterium]|nr:flagellar basal body P-ring formation chaperone FlgA [Acidobacteriota bacterium]